MYDLQSVMAECAEHKPAKVRIFNADGTVAHWTRPNKRARYTGLENHLKGRDVQGVVLMSDDGEIVARIGEAAARQEEAKAIVDLAMLPLAAVRMLGGQLVDIHAQAARSAVDVHKSDNSTVATALTAVMRSQAATMTMLERETSARIAAERDLAELRSSFGELLGDYHTLRAGIENETTPNAVETLMALLDKGAEIIGGLNP